jgi:glyoxylase-like metal-dependent hydrolase (beta-lactamase superfamily II)
MAEQVRTFALGAARVAILNAGDAIFDLVEEMNVPEAERHAAGEGIFVGPVPFPTQCVHIALLGASVLVDACDYDRCFEPESPHRPAEYNPLSMIEMLAAIGVRAEDVTHVVLTHAHFDHFSGVTVERDGKPVPAFPNARCYLGRGDWENPETQAALRDPGSLESRTLGVLWAEGRLELVESASEIAPSLRIVAAPGESPGHQLVRVESDGKTLYCLGDLFHHPVEVERPEWMAAWADAAAMLASRRALAEAALAADARLIAAHIRGVGRLAQAEMGIRWVEAR